jgi:prepilin-type N-terminal cleavage/methylation domain-containing protein
MKNTKGFTLIELLVVVSIIGILALMMLTQYSNVQRKAKASKIMDDVKTIQYAALVYKEEHNEWPPDTWWGETPSGMESYFLDSFSFDLPELQVKYSFDNYEKHPSWAKHYGTIVTISINSPDEALLSSVNGLVPGIFDPKEGFFGWKRLVFTIVPYHDS